MIKTEIYGTIGPACAKQGMLTEMFRLGMTGIRLNMSHTELAECRPWTDLIKVSACAAGISPRLLIDLRGPELRIGDIKQPIKLQEGEAVSLLAIGEAESILLSQPEYPWGEAEVPVPEVIFESFQKGQEVLLDDGKMQLEIIDLVKKTAHCKVIRGGILKSRKSIALPGIQMHLPVLTESDRRNIQNAKSHGVTGVMQPFVRNAKDLQKLKQELRNAGAPDLEVFAKIETIEGAEHLYDLLPYADQIVIARGDLGNSMPLWELPVVQDEIAKKCLAAEKPFMIVTQMLASMEENPVPTRAEVSDIFRAVRDGAASVMVTGETAVGKYPLETIRYLVNTVRAAEKYCRKPVH